MRWAYLAALLACASCNAPAHNDSAAPSTTSTTSTTSAGPAAAGADDAGACGPSGCGNGVLRPDRNLRGVWLSAPNNVWLSCSAGKEMVHFDGKTFEAVDVGAYMNAAWGFGKDDVWAVGAAGAIRHYDGKSWQPAESDSEATLEAVWGAAPDDLWAVGKKGAIIHYDGRKWAKTQSPTKRYLVHVHGSGPRDVWAVGDHVILHYDGRRWDLALSIRKQLPAPSRSTERGFCGTPQLMAKKAAEAEGQMRGVWARDPTDVWIVGGMGRGLHFDGRRWTHTELPRLDPQAVWGTAKDDVWAVGTFGIAHYDGTTWKKTSDGRMDLMAMAGTQGVVWAVGRSSQIQERRDGTWAARGVPHPKL